jgi:hypothetical protein
LRRLPFVTSSPARKPLNRAQRAIEFYDINFAGQADDPAPALVAGISEQDRDHDLVWVAAQADDAVMDQVLCTHNGDVLAILSSEPPCANGDDAWNKTHERAHQDY